jgi:16S rRNA processing protein RimM
VVLKFEGIDSITDAEQLGRVELQIPSEQRARLEAGAAFVSDLVGCEVWALGNAEPRLLGVVQDLQFGAGEAPLLVIRRKLGSGEDLLVPYAAEFLKSADFERRRIEMQLPEGLLELESPLSEEEKLRQRIEADEVRAAGIRRKPIRK